MIDQGVWTGDLMEKRRLTTILPRMKKNGYISIETVEKICCAMNCSIDNILEFIDDVGI